MAEAYRGGGPVTVFRDAQHILTAPVAGLSHDELVAAMTGEANIEEVASQSSTARRTEPPALEITALASAGTFADIDLTVAPGEVVGISGSGSSGRIALA